MRASAKPLMPIVPALNFLLQQQARQAELDAKPWKDRDDFEELFQVERRIAEMTGTLAEHRLGYPGVYNFSRW